MLSLLKTLAPAAIEQLKPLLEKKVSAVDLQIATLAVLYEYQSRDQNHHIEVAKTLAELAASHLKLCTSINELRGELVRKGIV